MGEPKDSALDRRKLSQLLGMIGSSHDGEALSAARAADRMVKQANATWSDVLDNTSAGAPPEPVPTERRSGRMHEIEIVLQLTQSKKIPAGLRLSIERMLPTICKGRLSPSDRRYLDQLYQDFIVEGREFR